MKNNGDGKFGTQDAIKKIGISAERLRYWERMGVVKPEYAQCGSRKFRRYGYRDIFKAILVKKLVDEDRYSLEGAIMKLTKGEL